VICATHAVIGAALGRLIGRPAPAFALGVLSHAVADLLPHRDYDLPREAALLVAALGLLAGRYGVGSPAWYGALGAAAPDLENAVGILTRRADDRGLFPTHRGLHGPRRQETWSQLVLAMGLLALARPQGNSTG